MAIRDSQDLTLVVRTPTTQNIRVSQDLQLVIKQPPAVHVRVSQDLTFVIVSRVTQAPTPPPAPSPLPTPTPVISGIPPIILDIGGNAFILGILNNGDLQTVSIGIPGYVNLVVLSDGLGNNWQVSLNDPAIALGQLTTTSSNLPAQVLQLVSPDASLWTISIAPDGTGRLIASKFTCVVPRQLDITESVFGIYPAGALICFDCNSTNLTVSADYSIWCCECQAFILPEKTNEFVLLE